MKMITDEQKLAAIGAVKQRLSELENERYSLEKQLSQLTGDTDLSEAVRTYVKEKANSEAEKLTGKQL